MRHVTKALDVPSRHFPLGNELKPQPLPLEFHNCSSHRELRRAGRLRSDRPVVSTRHAPPPRDDRDRCRSTHPSSARIARPTYSKIAGSSPFCCARFGSSTYFARTLRSMLGLPRSDSRRRVSLLKSDELRGPVDTVPGLRHQLGSQQADLVIVVKRPDKDTGAFREIADLDGVWVGGLRRSHHRQHARRIDPNAT